jgi:hypothetical protein
MEKTGVLLAASSSNPVQYLGLISLRFEHHPKGSAWRLAMWDHRGVGCGSLRRVSGWPHTVTVSAILVAAPR